MTHGKRSCLDGRISEIQAMIDGQALFKAGEMIKGGHHCATLRRCEHWSDCARSHTDLWEVLTNRIGAST